MRERRFVAYARHALVTAFRMCGVGIGSNVLLPNFICRDVLASIHSVGATPLYYDVDTDLQIRPLQILPKVDVAIAVNYFGFPADLQRLQTVLGDSVLIIEDNAHGWLSANEYGQPLGSRTPIGVTSFRKTIFVPDGAFLEWNSDVFSQGVEAFGSVAPRSDRLGASYHLRNIAHTVERVSHLPVLLALRSTARSARRAMGRTAIDHRPTEEFTLPNNVSIHGRSLRAFTQINTQREVERRRIHFVRCAEIARECGIQPVFSTLPDGVAPQGFPFFPDHGKIRGFVSRVQLRQLGEVMTWPALPQSTTLESNSPLRSLRLVNFLR